MSSPCKECIVKVMCKVACGKIEVYVDERVKALMPVKIDFCCSDFLSGIGWRLRNYPNKSVQVSHDNKHYQMIIKDGLIKKMFMKEKENS